MATHNRFQRWIADAAHDAGAAVPAELDPLGLSFEAEGRVVRIFPHADDAHAVIEVTATTLDDAAEDGFARLAVQLHRLNHEARFEHGWSVVLDDSNRLNVTTTVDVTHTRAKMLTGILYDGLDRAKALSAVVSGLAGALESEPEPDEPRPVTGHHHRHAIRG
jgi:hypothetical protein